jgi:hypothetical protein
MGKAGPAAWTLVVGNHFQLYRGKNIKFIEIEVKSQADVMNIW